jgi:hypothetical protein
MPILRELPLQVPENELPADPPFELAVTMFGHVTYVVGIQESPHFRTVDTTGRVVARFGTLGDGPGEARVDGNLFSLDSAVLFLSSADRLGVVYSNAGQFTGDFRNFESYLPIAVQGDLVIINRDFRKHDASFIEAVRLGKRNGHTLVPSTDSSLRAFGQRAAGPWPVAAYDGTRLVLGDGVRGELVMYIEGRSPRSFGRRLEPRLRTARELAEADSDIAMRIQKDLIGPDGRRRRGPDWIGIRRKLPFDTLPHFVRGGLSFDEEGRLWVIGRANDSIFADVYADTLFLGRRSVDCADGRREYPVALRGRWLALSCRQTDDSYRIRLFHIEES